MLTLRGLVSFQSKLNANILFNFRVKDLLDALKSAGKTADAKQRDELESAVKKYGPYILQ